MIKKFDNNIYKMSIPSFEENVKTLFEIDEKVSFKNDFFEQNKKSNKKRIAVIYDKDGWSFCNIAKEIKKNLSDEFDITIIPAEVFSDNPVRLFMLADQFDIIHCLWRGQLCVLNDEYAMGYIYNMGFTFDEFKKKFIDPANITTSVYDHNFLDKETFKWTKNFVKYCKNYTVSSEILKNIYDNLEIEKKPMAVISDGVNLQKFKPANLERFELKNLKNRKLKIGWVGNSEFIDSKGDSDLKGVKKIIKPVLEELIAEGYPIELKFADRNYGYIPSDKMPDYYNSIDIYVCASKNEGTPNPVLESMATGIPIISTNVGIVKEAFGEKQQKFILKERSAEELKEKLIYLLRHLELMKEMSDENLKQIQNWSWKNKCELFRKFFEANLNNI